MTDDEILAHYEWTTGACFRCARTDLDTTRLRQICPPAGGCHEVRACRACILTLEAERQRRVERIGGEYTPGQLRQE